MSDKIIEDLVKAFPWLSKSNVEYIPLESIKQSPEYDISVSEDEAYYNIKNKRGDSYAIFNVTAGEIWHIKIFGFYWMNLADEFAQNVFHTWYNFGDNFDVRVRNFGFATLALIAFVLGIAIGVLIQ